MSTHETKAYRATVKAAPGDAPAGTFTALVSVFGNVDDGGDRMMPGAFADTLAAWKASGDPIPVIWSHEWDDPWSHVGVVTNARETGDGLEITAQLDVTTNNRAAQVARLLTERRVTQFSFGYRAVDWQYVPGDGDRFTQVREIKAVDLIEVGPTLRGMNGATRLIEAASSTAGVKVGRTLSAKNEALISQAHDALGEVLDGLSEQKAAPAGGVVDAVSGPVDGPDEVPVDDDANPAGDVAHAVTGPDEVADDAAVTAAVTGDDAGNNAAAEPSPTDAQRLTEAIQRLHELVIDTRGA